MRRGGAHAPPRALPALPIRLEGARIVAVRGREALGFYVPGPRGPTFMTLIERTFGKDVTTRTWDTVAKVARDSRADAPRHSISNER